MKSINITPTWKEAMKIYIMLLQNGNAEGKKGAIEELMKIADHLDQTQPAKKTKK